MDISGDGDRCDVCVVAMSNIRLAWTIFKLNVVRALRLHIWYWSKKENIDALDAMQDKENKQSGD